CARGFYYYGSPYAMDYW
nr:immunoglobulin heavy chain junction region [Mus musculus]MBK4196769.1 immunoglobulin heavy chain junction region [Mus musculus]MBK4196770.1 immunoglobulin heavy chain junction region [Mus musculus]MBK4196771.1 immunoglobulin heavy chain junction region [Mus musculus]MBK4196772.1 immunoglobulin heavy chain junction region [Mus musculus]